MADTTYLTREVEDYVRSELARQTGQSFTKSRITLRTGGSHEFDAVSVDATVVASIKSASGKTSGGNVPSGKINDCLAELYYLSLVGAPTRFLVLTTPEFFEIFAKKTQGAVAEGIEIICIRLPPEMQAKVDAVKYEASQEVSPRVSSPPPHQMGPAGADGG